MRDWWLDWRNALLASPRFQRFAARSWLLRRPARMHARRLFDLVAGFTYSQTLFACVQLGLIERLAERSCSVEELAAACDLSVEAMDRLTGAAAAIGLVERRADERWTLGVAGAALAGNPGVAAMVAHHAHLYADLADPVALLRRGGGGGALAKFWAYGRGADPAAVADYSALMAASNAAVAEQLLDAYPIERHRRLLDIGGGAGLFLEAVGRRAPKVERGLFDLPAVVELARRRLGAGVAYYAGDAFNDALPEGYDAISLVRVLHDHDDAPALRLLRSIRAALPSAGTLLIGEPMVGTAGSGPVGPTYFAWYLAAMGSGRARTPTELGRLVEQAGFARWRPQRTSLPLVASLLVVNNN